MHRPVARKTRNAPLERARKCELQLVLPALFAISAAGQPGISVPLQPVVERVTEFMTPLFNQIKRPAPDTFGELADLFEDRQRLLLRIHNLLNGHTGKVTPCFLFAGMYPSISTANALLF